MIVTSRCISPQLVCCFPESFDIPIVYADSSKQSANRFTIKCFETITSFSFWPWYKQTVVVIGKCPITKFSISNQMPGEYILITDSDGFCIQIVLSKQVIDC
ncbi:hypothetical protein APX80_08455 [Escherichia coli]|nr:hypothetical protein APX80_08455 [Escherichia coli]